ncbi:hypothetical protein Pan181_27860 [Aeoliella mucimassa]|uniref:Uncharacterized protein n=1 Tax=Aeoliella mucimassa TaxID=2527972 RepID=A0A518APC8_9BACT|nr:hypothetical protein Pan181_27860 [Aeoliella mucimassa]
MKRLAYSLLFLAALAVSGSVASASTHFGRMAFVHHHSPSTSHVTIPQE